MPGLGLTGRAMQALCTPACFQQVLAVRPVARTPHFLLHHLAPASTMRPEPKLSTGMPPDSSGTVDDTPVVTVPAAAPVSRLGFIVPKRNARRAVTRNLIRRQARVVLAQAGLPAGDWVLRLRNGYDVRQFPSAASEALRRTVREELLQLCAQVGAPRRARVPA